MVDLKELGLYIAKLREKSGYKSQRQLYLASGISSATLSRIEAGIQRPQPETLKILSQYLHGVTYEELLEQAGYIEELEREENRPLTKEDIDELFADDPEGKELMLLIMELPDDAKKTVKDLLKQFKERKK